MSYKDEVQIIEEWVTEQEPVETSAGTFVLQFNNTVYPTYEAAEKALDDYAWGTDSTIVENYHSDMVDAVDYMMNDR